MTAIPKTAAEIKAALTRKNPVPCPTEGCENMVWHINMGVCDDCFESVVAVCRPVLIPGYTGERKVTSDQLFPRNKKYKPLYE